MNEIVSTTIPVPVRADTSDNPGDIFGFAIEAFRFGGAALATLVDIRGGAARALGAHMAIAANGRFCGYVSGGCVEAAVAAEAVQAIAHGSDRTLALGEGSPFFDVVLPCGGGISVAIHVLRNDNVLREVLSGLSARRPVSLHYSPQFQRLMISDKLTERSGWHDDEFASVYRPQTRLVISGQAGESEAVRRLAVAAGYDVRVVDSSLLRTQRSIEIDPFTAVILLHHDLDMEADILNRRLRLRLSISER